MTQAGNEIILVSGPNKAVILAAPLKIDFYQNDVLSVSVNAKGLMRFEHIRTKPEHKEPDENGHDNEANNVKENQVKSIEDEDPGAWEENFKSHHDAKPNGPEAVALDFTFPQVMIA